MSCCICCCCPCIRGRLKYLLCFLSTSAHLRMLGIAKQCIGFFTEKSLSNVKSNCKGEITKQLFINKNKEADLYSCLNEE